MGKGLFGAERITSEHVEEWDKVFWPHIDSKYSAEEKFAFRRIRRGGRIISYSSPVQDFSLEVGFNDAGDVPGEVSYARKMEPYFPETQSYLNTAACHEISRIVSPAARSIGMDGFVDTLGYAAGFFPAVVFRGNFPFEDFDEVRKLFFMTENMIDFKLKEIDQRMDRPFCYAVLPKVDERMRDPVYFEKIDGVSVLDGAIGVLKLARELDYSCVGPSSTFTYFDQYIKRVVDENHGRFLSVDEFVGSSL